MFLSCSLCFSSSSRRSLPMLRRSGSSDAPEEYKPRLQGALVVNDLFAREVAVVGGQRGFIRQDAREVLQERGLGDLLGTVRGIAGDLTTGFRTCLAGVVSPLGLKTERALS